ncbi:MAG TPA: hypothetical protein VIF57_00585 [Polyangia bacterium]|jgi:hypothetical protein
MTQSRRTLRAVRAGVLVPMLLGPLSVAAQDNTAAPAAPEAAPAPEKKKPVGSGPGLSLSPETPQVGGRVTSPAEPAPVVVQEPTAEWKFEVSGYFRAPMRMSWGPATTQDPNGGDPGTQLRTPPLVPDANYIDWRYTNSLVAPWTELNFKYGNDRVKATVQIASYNLTDPGYRRLEANLGINQAYIQMLWPELGGNDNLHLTATVGGFTNRYGAAGRYDAGKYETYLFGRTHVAGATVNITYDANEDVSYQVEAGGGAKLEPIPFYGSPGPVTGAPNPNTQLPPWEPYPGPVAPESGFLAHVHLGAVIKKQWIIGAHFIDVFSNDNERSTAFTGMTFNEPCGMSGDPCGRPSTDPKPRIMIYGADVKQLSGLFGDAYLGFSVLDARNALYLPDAIEVIHSFGGWQLHDNYFGAPGATDPVTGKVYSAEFQYSFSWGALMWYPQPFWGQGPDLITTVFGMFNHVDLPAGQNPTFDNINKLKFGAEVTYLPYDWGGIGFRGDVVEPNLKDSTQNFSVFSPRLIFRTAFVTHEQILLQYSRYFVGDHVLGMFPYNQQPGAGLLNGVDKNAFQIAAIIWF